jgi:hypothetical protein
MYPSRGFLKFGLVCAFALGIAADVEAHDWNEGVEASFTIPPSGEPAKTDEPPCGNPGAQGSATSIVQLAGKEIDQYIGQEVSPDFVASPAIKNKLGQWLGINNGPSVCKMLCIVVPNNKPVNYQVEFRIIESDGSMGNMYVSPSSPDLHQLDVRHNWGATRNPTIARSAAANTVCLTGKNWSHDAERDFVLRGVWD